MNKQELYKEIIDLDKLYGDGKKYVELESVLHLVSQLKEPQKITVPKFVADWICYLKCWNYGLHYGLANASDEVLEWLCVDKLKRQELFARAWLDGYTVEKEKQYYVRFKGMESDDFNYLNFIKFQHAWVLSSIKLDKKFRTEHTKKQLEEAGFGWVFDCPGIEIEEVPE